METQKKIFFLFCMSAVLLGFFLCQFPASALEPEDEPQDSGIILDIEDEPEEPSESDSPETLPSEEDIDLWEEEVPSTTPDMIDLDLSTVSADVAAIRQNSDIFLYFVIPVSCAFFLICKFCVWFYSTFVKDAGIPGRRRSSRAGYVRSGICSGRRYGFEAAYRGNH